jgi:hypothetical protein
VVDEKEVVEEVVVEDEKEVEEEVVVEDEKEVVEEEELLNRIRELLPARILKPSTCRTAQYTITRKRDCC